MSKKVKTFKSKKAQEEFFSFVDNHLENIRSCADLSHFACNKKTLYEEKYTSWAMSISSDYRYLDFDLNINSEYASEKWENKKYRQLISTLCHELAHIVTEEINSCIDKKKTSHRYYMERITEHTSRWLFQLYLKYMKEWGIDESTGQAKKLEKFLKANK